MSVAVKQHKSEQLVNLFPPANREGTMQTKGDVKAQLERAGSSGYSFVDLLADFHLLLFLDADAFFDKPFVSEGLTHTAGHLRVPAVVGRRAPEGPAEDELRHTVEERSPCGQRPLDLASPHRAACGARRAGVALL